MWGLKLKPKKIRIIDVIFHKNQYHTQLFLVLNRNPNFKYEKKGNWLIAEDSGFYNFFHYEAPSRNFEAFGGREFDIHLKNGEIIKAKGQWWAGTPKEYNYLSSGGGDTIEGLKECHVFSSVNFEKHILEKWLSKNTPSNNYYKYDKRSKDFGKHIIISKFDN